MDCTEFNKFFKPYSENVDQAAEINFWRLSDTLVEKILTKELQHLQKNATILDAGGGTGRWIIKMSNSFPTANFILYDLSEDMLNQANKNIIRAGIESQVKIIKGDLCSMNDIDDHSVDAVWSLYAPIGFVDSPAQAFSELFRILKPSGKLIIMGHGYHNSLYSKAVNYAVDGGTLETMAKTYTVKWAEYVPTLYTFSQESMNSYLENAGFRLPKCYGIPVFLQPGSEDFDPTNKACSKISNSLRDEEFFNSAIELEMSMNSIPTVVNRGVNIMGVGIK